jgi:hypothetical protein
MPITSMSQEHLPFLAKHFRSGNQKRVLEAHQSESMLDCQVSTYAGLSQCAHARPNDTSTRP